MQLRAVAKASAIREEQDHLEESAVASVLQGTMVEPDREPSAEEEANACVVCLDACKNTVLLPCRHMCVCSACAGELSVCPLCRSEVRDQMQVYT